MDNQEPGADKLKAREGSDKRIVSKSCIDNEGVLKLVACDLVLCRCSEEHLLNESSACLLMP